MEKETGLQESKDARREARRERGFRWGFGTAALVILALVVAGELVGRLLSTWPPARALLLSLRGLDAPPVLASMGVRDWVFAAFLVSTAGYLWLQRDALLRFFRSMHVGVTLMTLSTFAVLLGVLVPQIENFEDPDERVTAANYELNYSQFRWAEAYFLYHLMHPYGIGMPAADVPAGAVEGLAKYAQVYGEEEARNRGKLMESAFSGNSKSEEISAFARRHDATLRKAFDVATALQLNRLYKSSWFATLLLLLACGVAANTFKGSPRRWFSIGKVGYVVTHFGMLTLLAGGFVSKQFTDRGILQLYLGDKPQDTYNRHYRDDKLARMPFALRLDHFARKEWKALEVIPMQADLASRLPRYTLWPGREIPIDHVPEGGDGDTRPRLLLRVLDLHDHARVGLPDVREGAPDDGEGPLPVVELQVPNEVDRALLERRPEVLHEEGPTRRIYLSPAMSNQGYFDPESRFRLVAVHDKDPEALFTPELDEVLGTLDIEVQGTSDTLPIPVRFRLGERVKLPRGYELEVVDATKDFRDFQTNRARKDVLKGSSDTRPLAEQPDRVAAVWIDIHPPGGGEPERRLVIEVMDPIEYGLQEGYEHKEVIARLRWDRWTAPGPPRYVLAWGTGREPVLATPGAQPVPVEAGAPLPLPGEGRVVPLRFLERARFEKRIEYLPDQVDEDGWNRSFYSRDARGLELEVVHEPGTPEERREVVRMATTQTGSANVWFTEDRRFALRFLENDEGFPYDWRSVLSVVETDAEGRSFTVPVGPPKSREIRVNDYFKYKGYRFFQTNADPTVPTYSGIGVVYDPGIPIVLAGMYTVILGTFLAFIVRPIVLARRRREVTS